MNVASSSNRNNNINIYYAKKTKLQSENIKALEQKQKKIKKIILTCIISAIALISANYIVSQSKSSYELWKEMGNTGSKQQYISSLKGSIGDNGNIGSTGSIGDKGISAYERWKASDSSNSTKSESDYLDTLKGPTGNKGISAYESWKALRPRSVSSSIQDYINSLKGEDGDKGVSSFEIWQAKSPDNKNRTEAEYISTLKGIKGDKGDSAFEAWKKQNAGNDLTTESEYIASLRGVKGDKGYSAYEAWRNSNEANKDKTVQDYLLSLKGDKGDKGPAGGFMVGEIRFFTSEMQEDGWLLCDGQKFDPVKYTELFYTLSSDKVPNLKGRTVAMYDTTNKIGSEAGSNNFKLTKDYLPNNSYTFDISHSHDNKISTKTTEDGLHSHEWKNRFGSGNITQPGGFFHGGISGSLYHQVKLEDSVNHTHAVNKYQMTQDSETKIIRLNDGTQVNVDNRQQTFYAAAYIFAGYEKE